MLMPTNAIARVRTSGRVRSASSAVTAADTAPAPCTQRATKQRHERVRERADQRARGVEQQADRDHRLAAVAVRPAAERDLQHAPG